MRSQVRCTACGSEHECRLDLGRAINPVRCLRCGAPAHLEVVAEERPNGQSRPAAAWSPAGVQPGERGSSDPDLSVETLR